MSLFSAVILKFSVFAIFPLFSRPSSHLPLHPDLPPLLTSSCFANFTPPLTADQSSHSSVSSGMTSYATGLMSHRHRRSAVTLEDKIKISLLKRWEMREYLPVCTCSLNFHIGNTNVPLSPIQIHFRITAAPMGGALQRRLHGNRNNNL